MRISHVVVKQIKRGNLPLAREAREARTRRRCHGDDDRDRVRSSLVRPQTADLREFSTAAAAAAERFDSVVHALMLPQMIPLPKFRVTPRAAESSRVRVNEQMLPEDGRLLEGSFTNSALKWPFVIVASSVGSQSRSLSEFPLADVARVRLLAGVYALVSPQVSALDESAATRGALVRPATSGVSELVPFQAAAGGEELLAADLLAFERGCLGGSGPVLTMMKVVMGGTYASLVPGCFTTYEAADL